MLLSAYSRFDVIKILDLRDTTKAWSVPLGYWKQWKWKPEEMENGNCQNLLHMNARVKPLINDHILKTTSVQRPHNNYVPKTTDD